MARPRPSDVIGHFPRGQDGPKEVSILTLPPVRETERASTRGPEVVGHANTVPSVTTAVGLTTPFTSLDGLMTKVSMRRPKDKSVTLMQRPRYATALGILSFSQACQGLRP